ncbi:MAG: cysteine--tRNA ligase [Phycisphaeraceae bacterium]|nr:cysteine--tRNA ligase [Phycisphaeraceae bacterium]
MPIRFYNTLTHQMEEFTPSEPPLVTMYNCGPTVYDFAHIGNFRAFVFADVLRRFLELSGFDVRQVMNLTDVGHMTDDQLADGGGEDKMQLAANRLKAAKKQGVAHAANIVNPDDPYEVARFYIDAFLDDAKKLGLKIVDDPRDERGIPKNMPRATEYVGRMMKLILQLVENGYAYVSADGAVYYSVESFPEYGRLSGNTLDRLRGGAGGRVQAEHQAQKRHPADFLLWKTDSTHIMKWESPWGVGYPGWHIECSAMAMTLLERETIDIHTGGEDNIFPHHECEIAQSCGATGRPRFANYWMHTRFLLVEGEKMSKSKGNFFTVRDLLSKGVDPAVIRFELLKAHYRSNMNFTTKGLEDSASAVRRLRDAAANFERAASAGSSGSVDLSVEEQPIVTQFKEYLADDLNMSGALGAVFKWLSESHSQPAESLAALRKLDSVLNVLNPSTVTGDDGGAAAKCAAIDAARAAKDFATADRLRKELQADGYEVMNSKAGTTARKKLA